jgi:sensor histidine kinase YesM
MELFTQKKDKVLHHGLLWAAVWLFYVFFFSYNSTNTNYILLFSTALIPVTAATAYAFVDILIPKYLRPKKYIWFGIYAFGILLFTIFCVVLLLIVSVAFIPNLTYDDLPPLNKNYVFVVTLVYLVVFILSFASLWQRNTQTVINNTELQQELLSARFQAKEQELNYLKNQIHPHFLFNSLNTIYGLALKKSVETPDVILKLSGLLDYILYNANKPVIPLSDEINHIENYIALEKIRFKDTLEVPFSKETIHKDVLVAPMLLLPFVENAFKHGKIIDGFLRIMMDIRVTDQELHFYIKNTCKENAPIEEGIGLKNIKDRLEILYPNNHDLQMGADSSWFEVRLKIKY